MDQGPHAGGVASRPHAAAVAGSQHTPLVLGREPAALAVAQRHSGGVHDQPRQVGLLDDVGQFGVGQVDPAAGSADQRPCGDVGPSLERVDRHDRHQLHGHATLRRQPVSGPRTLGELDEPVGRALPVGPFVVGAGWCGQRVDRGSHLHPGHEGQTALDPHGLLGLVRTERQRAALLGLLDLACRFGTPRLVPTHPPTGLAHPPGITGAGLCQQRPLGALRIVELAGLLGDRCGVLQRDVPVAQRLRRGRQSSQLLGGLRLLAGLPRRASQPVGHPVTEVLVARRPVAVTARERRHQLRARGVQAVAVALHGLDQRPGLVDGQGVGIQRHQVVDRRGQPPRQRLHRIGLLHPHTSSQGVELDSYIRSLLRSGQDHTDVLRHPRPRSPQPCGRPPSIIHSAPSSGTSAADLQPSCHSTAPGGENLTQPGVR